MLTKNAFSLPVVVLWIMVSSVSPRPKYEVVTISIQALEIDQTPDGPVIRGLFVPFGVPAPPPEPPCPPNVGCPQGSNPGLGAECCFMANSR